MRYSEQEARTLVVQAGHRLLQCGLVARTWGNISARVSDTHFVITPSGRSYDTLREEDLVLVQIADCSYQGQRKPSSEKGIHAAAYRHRPDAGFVIHTHQDYASCVGVGGKSLTNLQHPLLGEFVPGAAYGMPSTKKLQKGVEAAMVQHPESKAILMRQHGALCIAEDFEEAFAVAQALEAVSKEVFERTVALPQRIPVKEDLLQTLSNTCLECYFGLVTDAAVQAVAGWRKTLLPHLDDLAQIAGARIPSVSKDPAAILKAFQRSNAVLIPGVGAVCCAKDQGDLGAIETIMRKSCMAALYAEASGATPLSAIDRRIMRFVYTMKYAKKKTEQ